MNSRFKNKQNSNKYWFKSLFLSIKNFIIDNYINLIISVLVLGVGYYIYRRNFTRSEVKKGILSNSVVESKKNKTDEIIDNVGDKVEAFTKLSVDKAINTAVIVKDTLTGKTLKEAEDAKAAALLLAEKYKSEVESLKRTEREKQDKLDREEYNNL